jgi:hypothetical protein
MISGWVETHADHVFCLQSKDGMNSLLRDLGPRPEACREPINVVSTAKDEVIRLISNLAHTPFELHGRTYASVEGFWQGLKFPGEADRQRIAPLHGTEAKRAGEGAPEADIFEYQGQMVRVGTYEHWSLMHQACWAKFSQHGEARRALLSTGARPLVHRVRRGSRTIPGAVMAEIWMKVRARLAEKSGSRVSK